MIGFNHPYVVVGLLTVWQCSLAPSTEKEAHPTSLVAHEIVSDVYLFAIFDEGECPLPSMLLNEVVDTSHDSSL